jgi:hypothetical protein
MTYIENYHYWVSEWVSEWVLFNANSAIFQLYHGENKLIFNEMMMRSAVYWNNTLSWIVLVLVDWNNFPRVDMSLHSDTLYWFRANQSLLFLLIDACLAKKQQTRPVLEPTIYHTRSEHANHYATDVVLVIIIYICFIFIIHYWYL